MSTAADPLLFSPACSVASPLEIARNLLADDTVRSVTIDPSVGQATVHYRDAHVEQNSLTALAADVRSNQAKLAETQLADVLCWPDSVTGRAGYVRSPEQATGWRRAMHLTLAAFWFGMAILGVILPGVPTTCFLLACSYSLLRSSHRLHNKLLESKLFGPSLRHWRLYRGVRPGVKTKAMSMLLLVVGATVVFSGLPMAALAGITAGAAIGAFCILRLRVVEV